MNFTPIGTIRTPFTDLKNMPIQPKGAREVEGQVVVKPEFAEGLKDLDGFSHLYLIYVFHKAPRTSLTVVPFMDTEPRGIFSTRSPLRPNHIGLSIVELVEVRDNVVRIKGADVLDDTPLLDIKPYIEPFEYVLESRSGWMKAGRKEVEDKRSDGRFV